MTAIQPMASRLVHFVRQPNWVTGAFGDQPRDYTNEEIEEFKNKPGHLLETRKKFERVVNSYFGNYLKDSPIQAGMRAYLAQNMKDQLKSTGLEDVLVPNYGVGCRRPTPGVGYLEALKAENVDTVFGPLGRITATGTIDSSGKEHHIDVLVCATGFDTSYKPRFPQIGAGGKNMQDEWARSTKAYMATTIPHFPNFFMFYGPNNPFASGAYISAIGMISVH